MFFKKQLQFLLFTSALLGAVCAHAMDGEPMDAQKVALSAAKRDEEAVLSNNIWADLAPTICSFLDAQSFGRFQRVSKIFHNRSLYYLECLPKGKDLIAHLKPLSSD